MEKDTTIQILESAMEEQPKPKKMNAKEAKAVTEDAKLKLYEFEVSRIYNKIDSESSSAGHEISTPFHRNLPEESIQKIINKLSNDGYTVNKENKKAELSVSW